LKTTKNEETRERGEKEGRRSRRGKEEKGGVVKRGAIFTATGGKIKSAALKLPRLRPLVLLVQILRNAELPCPKAPLPIPRKPAQHSFSSRFPGIARLSR
jgi:hypothetical protein